MIRIVATVSLLLLFSGCQIAQLSRETTLQAPTVTDIYYSQVLGNIAALHESPELLPYFSVAGTSVNQIQLALQMQGSIGIDLLTNIPKSAFAWYLDKTSLAPQGSEQKTDSWTSATTTDPDELYLMQSAYLKAMGSTDATRDAALRNFFGDSTSSRYHFINPGWFAIGCKDDMPKCVCHYACRGNTYVWVTEDGMRGLSQFTLAILDIATAATTNHVAPASRLAQRIKDLNDKAASLKTLIQNTDLGEMLIAQLKEELKRVNLELALAQLPDDQLAAASKAFDDIKAFEGAKNPYREEMKRRNQEPTGPSNRMRKNFYLPNAGFSSTP